MSQMFGFIISRGRGRPDSGTANTTSTTVNTTNTTPYTTAATDLVKLKLQNQVFPEHVLWCVDDTITALTVY